MVVQTPNNPMLKLLIITEILNNKRALSPFFKNKNDLENNIADMLRYDINLEEVQEALLIQTMRKFNSLPIGVLFKDALDYDFDKKKDEYVFSFHFVKEIKAENYSCTVEIRFKKNSTGSIEAYKKCTYDGPSGMAFQDFLSEVNKALLPHACANLINELFELTD